MDRTRFYEILDKEGVQEVDFLSNGFSDFKMKYRVGYYRVTEADIMRPDMISYKNYGTVKYWWIICYVNGIADPLSDLKVGQLLKIPNIIDIYDFFKGYRKR